MKKQNIDKASKLKKLIDYIKKTKFLLIISIISLLLSFVLLAVSYIWIATTHNMSIVFLAMSFYFIVLIIAIYFNALESQITRLLKQILVEKIKEDFTNTESLKVDVIKINIANYNVIIDNNCNIPYYELNSFILELNQELCKQLNFKFTLYSMFSGNT